MADLFTYSRHLTLMLNNSAKENGSVEKSFEIFQIFFNLFYTQNSNDQSLALDQ